MNVKKSFEIVNNEKIYDVYYEEQPVWIQEVNENTAKIGFLNNNEERKVFVTDLHE